MKYGMKFLMIAATAAVLAVSAAYADEAAAATPEVAAQTETPAPAVEERAKRGMEFGGRVALGNTYTLGIDLRTPLSESMRLYFGLDGGYVFGTFGYHAYSVETNVFAEFIHNISKEGDFRFFWGFGGAFGYQGVWGEKPYVDLVRDDSDLNVPIEQRPILIPLPEDHPDYNPRIYYPRIGYEKDSGNNLNFGLGLKFGLETTLAFIDPEHSLYRLRDATVSIDFRPVIYFLDVNGLENYPWLVWGIGMSFRWLI